MKDFLTTKKGKMIAGIGTLAVVAAVVAAVILLNLGYRTIAVKALTGSTTVQNGGTDTQAYVGLHLKSGDDVRVDDTGDLTLAVDQDKYLYAESATHFWIEAAGKLNDTRTKVVLDEGSGLYRIDQKLRDGEYFKVDTPNSTMSVRGTVFRTTIEWDESGYPVTRIEVFEGEVYVERLDEKGMETDDYRIVTAGQCVLVRSHPDYTEFVEDAYADENSDYGLIDTANLPDGVREIDYKEVPESVALVLGVWMDEGRELCISKDLLFDYTGIKEHEYGEIDSDAVSYGENFKLPTCSEEGYYFAVCTVCGEVDSEKRMIPKKDHIIITEGTYCEEEGHIYSRCEECGEIFEDTGIPAKDHRYDSGIVTKAATDTSVGEKTYTCTVCGMTKTEVIPKTAVSEEAKASPKAEEKPKAGDIAADNSKVDDAICNGNHSFTLSTTIPTTCMADGTEVYSCSKCGFEKLVGIPRVGHSLDAYGDCVYGCGYHEDPASYADVIFPEPDENSSGGGNGGGGAACSHSNAYYMNPAGGGTRYCPDCGQFV